MGKTLFISHSSEDKEVVSLFVDKLLIAGCGISQDDIFYTSSEDTGVNNGDDIPSAIKDSITDSAIFFMMVSDNYKKSEVCLNEMGAAWILDDVRKCILLLPNIGFDKIGWLMSLRKGTNITNDQGLDAICDILKESLKLNIKTATWNKNKQEFLKEVSAMTTNVDSQIGKPDNIEDDEDLDFLTLRERFENHMSEYTSSLDIMTVSMNTYSEKLSLGTKQLNNYTANPHALTTSQLRGVFVSMANETNKLADINEEHIPLVRKHFDMGIKYAILLRQKGTEDATADSNRIQVQYLIDSMVAARKEIKPFMEAMEDMIDMDRSFTKAKNRLKKTMEDFLATIAFCINRANEYLLN